MSIPAFIEVQDIDENGQEQIYFLNTLDALKNPDETIIVMENLLQKMKENIETFEGYITVMKLILSDNEI